MSYKDEYVKYECECKKETTYGIWKFKKDNTFSIESCCGGGCEAASDIKYCPYCSRILK